MERVLSGVFQVQKIRPAGEQAGSWLDGCEGIAKREGCRHQAVTIINMPIFSLTRPSRRTARLCANSQQV
jgi:hypothetical protein